MRFFYYHYAGIQVKYHVNDRLVFIAAPIAEANKDCRFISNKTPLASMLIRIKHLSQIAFG